jgi:hypothetical protein
MRRSSVFTGLGPDGGKVSFVRTAGYRHGLTKSRSARAVPTLTDELEGFEPDHVDLTVCARPELPAASDAAASGDAAFRAFVASGDGHRDAGAWVEAEASYGAAVALYPYQPGYWVQLGHMRKEQGHFAAAEVAYRTAAALGVSPAGVTEHLCFVMAKQGADNGDNPIRITTPGETAQLVPAQPDVLLLARLLWRAQDLSDEEMLELLRKAESLDALFAAMVGDPRFVQANVQWLSFMRDGDLA